jgi:DNA-binding transcriptional regulator YdaS (Cro superfamily)
MDDLKPPYLLAAERAIDLLGGPVAAARRLEIERYQTVQSWLRNRVPAEYCPLIERATEGRVRCEELRPDIAWDVLRLQAGQDSGASAPS